LSVFKVSSLNLRLLVVVLMATVVASANSAGPSLLDTGYDQMYNLDFTEAHRTFQTWEKLHPEDPLGPASDAAAYLFSEFDRLHVLQLQLFADDQKFGQRDKRVPDASVKLAFDRTLTESDALAATALAKNPDDANALFAEALANGLRSDYAAMIEKRNLSALSYVKKSRTTAEKLLAKYPSYYDAYLAIGVENYLLGLNSAPLRWLLHIGGAQTNKEEGLAKLRLTAEHGHYLAPYARLLLAVAAVRDKDSRQAKVLLQGLAQEFPRNPLYGRELARLQEQPSTR